MDTDNGTASEVKSEIHFVGKVQDASDGIDDNNNDIDVQAKLESLEMQIAQSPYNQSLFDSLITFLSKHISEAGFSIKLESFRQQYIYRFPTSSSFWSSWLADAILLTSSSGLRSSSSESAVGLKELFDMALSRSPTLSTVLIYVEYYKKMYEEDYCTEADLRKCLEKAVGTLGCDMYTGLIVWRSLIEFEIDELEDLMEIQRPSNEIQAAKKNICQLCHKLLSNPLANLEEALQFVSEVLESVMVETDEKLIQPEVIQKKFAASMEAREARLTYEDHINDEDAFNSKTVEERLKTWKAYIDFEMKDANLTRAHRIFERAICDCNSSIELVFMYLNFARFEMKSWDLVKSIAERSFAVSYNSIKVWKLRLFALEYLKEDFTLVLSAFDQAIGCGLPTAEDYLMIHLMKCDYINRYIIQSCRSSRSTGDEEHDDSLGSQLSDIATAFSLLKAAFQHIETFLDAYYREWLEGWTSYVSHRVKTEQFLVSEIEKTFPFSKSGASSSGGGSHPDLGIECDCRIVFESILSRFPKDISVWNMYIEWSRANEPTSSTRRLYKRVTQTLTDGNIEMIYKDWLRFESIFGTVNEILGISDKLDEISERKERENEELKKAERAERALENKRDARPIEGDLKRKRPEHDSSASGGHENKKTKEIVSSNSQSLNNHSSSNTNSSSNVSSTNISSNSTTEPTITSTSATPGQVPGVKLADADRHYTVYVSKFSKSTTEDDLREIFAACGAFASPGVKINVDKVTGANAGHGLVQFESLQGRQAALKMCNKVHDKEGNTIMIVPSKFPIVTQKSAPISNNYSNNINNNINNNNSKNSDSNIDTAPAKVNPYLSGSIGGDAAGGSSAPKPKSTLFKPRSVALISKTNESTKP